MLSAARDDEIEFRYTGNSVLLQSKCWQSAHEKRPYHKFAV